MWLKDLRLSLVLAHHPQLLDCPQFGEIYLTHYLAGLIIWLIKVTNILLISYGIPMSFKILWCGNQTYKAFNATFIISKWLKGEIFLKIVSCTCTKDVHVTNTSSHTQKQSCLFQSKKTLEIFNKIIFLDLSRVHHDFSWHYQNVHPRSHNESGNNSIKNISDL
jgi:hypothetical protein